MDFLRRYCNIKIIILSLIINFYQKGTNNENLARIFNFNDLSYLVFVILGFANLGFARLEFARKNKYPKIAAIASGFCIKIRVAI